MVDAIANLATDTASDRDAIAQLTATVARLTTEIATLNVKLVVDLQKNRVSWGGRGGRNITIRVQGARAGAVACTGTGAGAPARTGASAPTMDDTKYLEPKIYYCWTCGPGCRHNSAKCPLPAAGHIYTVTKRNMQVGAEAT